jgi:hypothetical protein
MPVVIFITVSKSSYNPSSYNDSISVNNNGDKKITFTGQSAGKKDHELIKGIQDNDKFLIYSRIKQGMPFSYRGSTRCSRVVRNRSSPIGRIQGSRKWHAASDAEILIVEFNIPSCPDPIVPVISSARTKFKSSALIHTGLFNASTVPNSAVDGFYTRVSLPSSPLVEARMVSGTRTWRPAAVLVAILFIMWVAREWKI